MIDDKIFQNLIRSKYILLQAELETLKDLQGSINETKALAGRRLSVLEP